MCPRTRGNAVRAAAPRRRRRGAAGRRLTSCAHARARCARVPLRAPVMADVTRTMYNASFVGELFKPQEIYSVASVRQVFDRLAHSSIMRLNEASMDKLFDLMLMGFKYQLLSCSYPAEMLQVTLNHLRALQSKVGDAQVGMLVAAAEERVHQVRLAARRALGARRAQARRPRHADCSARVRCARGPPHRCTARWALASGSACADHCAHFSRGAK